MVFSKKTTAEAYIGNSGLCGEAKGLTPRSSPANSGSIKEIVLFGDIIPFCGVLFIVMIVYGILRFGWQAKPLDEESKSIQENDQFLRMVLGREARFTFAEIVEATNDFNDMYCIGVGGVGSVYRAELPTGEVFAVKKLNISDSDEIPAMNLCG